MGIRSMPWDEWIELDDEFAQTRRVCAYRIRTMGDRLVQVHPAQPGIVESGHAAGTHFSFAISQQTGCTESAGFCAGAAEECMYELYAEPDKTGKQSVAAKYKYVPLSPSGHILLICADHLQ